MAYYGVTKVNVNNFLQWYHTLPMLYRNGSCGRLRSRWTMTVLNQKSVLLRYIHLFHAVHWEETVKIVATKDSATVIKCKRKIWIHEECSIQKSKFWSPLYCTTTYLGRLAGMLHIYKLYEKNSTTVKMNKDNFNIIYIFCINVFTFFFFFYSLEVQLEILRVCLLLKLLDSFSLKWNGRTFVTSMSVWFLR